jgi:hypothetical protein
MLVHGMNPALCRSLALQIQAVPANAEGLISLCARM